jgi:hypothetical protein
VLVAALLVAAAAILGGTTPGARAEDGCRIVVVDLGDGRTQICTVCVVGWWSRVTCR